MTGCYLQVMGTFYVGAKIENISDRDNGAIVPRLLVDTGSEYTWVAAATLEKLGIKREKKDVAFAMANGQLITRSVGFAIVRVDKAFTVDEVVFAEKGDILLLGARSLEGLNLAVDSRKKKLVHFKISCTRCARVAPTTCCRGAETETSVEVQEADEAVSPLGLLLVAFGHPDNELSGLPKGVQHSLKCSSGCWSFTGGVARQ